MHTFTHTQDYFAIWLNTVYFLICLILWCKCSVLLWCVGEGSFWVFLDFWVGQRRFSISVTVTSSLSFTSSCFWGESFAVLPFSHPARDWKFETPFCWNWSQAHSWFFSVRAVVFLFFFFQSFLLQQYNMCLVLADSHVYKVHICVHMCNTRYSSNLLLWLLLIMMMILVSAPFFFLSWFLVDELCWFGCSQELKKGRWLFMILHTLFYFRGLWTF